VAGKTYALLLSTGPRPVPVEIIQSKLDEAGLDWLRVKNDQYFVHGPESANPIYELIKSILHANDTFVCVEVNLNNRYSWTVETVIDWFKKHAGA
jgi:hypothetical protein